MRYWIYGHVAAVICCALASIADRQGMLTWPASIWIEIGVGVPLWVSLFALFLCPIAVLILLLNGSQPWKQIVSIVAAETLLTLGQLMALLPMCQ